MVFSNESVDRAAHRIDAAVRGYATLDVVLEGYREQQEERAAKLRAKLEANRSNEHLEKQG